MSILSNFPLITARCAREDPSGGHAGAAHHTAGRSVFRQLPTSFRQLPSCARQLRNGVHQLSSCASQLSSCGVPCAVAAARPPPHCHPEGGAGGESRPRPPLWPRGGARWQQAAAAARKWDRHLLAGADSPLLCPSGPGEKRCSTPGLG